MNDTVVIEELTQQDAVDISDKDLIDRVNDNPRCVPSSKFALYEGFLSNGTPVIKGLEIHKTLEYYNKLKNGKLFRTYYRNTKAYPIFTKVRTQYHRLVIPKLLHDVKRDTYICFIVSGWGTGSSGTFPTFPDVLFRNKTINQVRGPIIKGAVFDSGTFYKMPPLTKILLHRISSTSLAESFEYKRRPFKVLSYEDTIAKLNEASITMPGLYEYQTNTKAFPGDRPKW